MKSLKTYISILKSIKNRPTKVFYYLVFVIVALFSQAYMHNYNIVYLMMFFLVGVGSASSIFGVLNLYGVQISLLSHERFFANTKADYTLLVQNDSPFKLYDINITCEDETASLALIEPHKSKTARLQHSFAKRGEAFFAQMKIHSLFPLPHEVKYKFASLEKKVLVYPQPKGESLFKVFRKNRSAFGEIDDFEGLKHFNQGENISTIHWPSLAKNDSLKSKNFVYEDENKKLSFNFKNMRGSDEQKLSQLTFWVLECEKYAFDFTLLLNDTQLDSKELSFDAVLQTLATY